VQANSISGDAALRAGRGDSPASARLGAGAERETGEAVKPRD